MRQGKENREKNKRSVCHRRFPVEETKEKKCQHDIKEKPQPNESRHATTRRIPLFPSRKKKEDTKERVCMSAWVDCVRPRSLP